jgi:hypothetical protein
MTLPEENQSVIRAQLHDGRMLEFPAGTDASVIQATVKKVLGQEPSAQASAPQTERPVTSLFQVESENSPARLFLKPPEESLSKTERVIDAFTAIPKGITKGGAYLFGTLGDIYDVAKMGSDAIRDRLPWWLKGPDNFLGTDELAETLGKRLINSEEIIEGLKGMGVPLDRPKTRLGRYIESFDSGATSFLAPGAWIKHMLKLGGISGLAGEAGEELTGSPLGRTAAQMAAILLTPRLRYSNAGKLLRENMEFNTQRELNDAHKLVQDSHRVDYPLLGPEALSRGPIQGLMADVLASPSGGQLLSALLKDRPGRVAKIKDKFQALLGPSHAISAPDTVRKLLDSTAPGAEAAIRTLATRYRAAFPGWVADYIERAYEAAAKNIRGGPSLDSGWQFADALVGTPQRKKNFEAMIEGLPPEAREEINTTLKVLGHSGKLKEIGETAGRGRAEEIATRNDASSIRLWWKGKKSQQARERLHELDKRGRRTYYDLAKAMGSKRRWPLSSSGERRFDRDTILKMMALADVFPRFPHAGHTGLSVSKKLGILLTGERADLGALESEPND